MTVRTSIRSQNIGGYNYYGMYGDPAVVPPNSAVGRSSAGVVVNDRSAVSLSAVYSCLRVLGDAAGMLDVHVYRKTPNGQPDIEVDLPSVITDPYADISARTGVFQSVSSLGLGGNLYRHIIDRDDQGNPTQVELLNPSMLKVALVQGVKTYQLGAVGPTINPDDMIHVPWLALPGSVVGLNPIEIMASTLGIALASEDYAARFFAQGISPGGILSVDKPLTPADSQRLQRELQVNHAGVSNAHVAMITDAQVKWQQLSINPETAQLLESRQFSREEICGAYGVPLALLGDPTDRGGTYYKGVQELIIAFTLFSLTGWTQRLDEADSMLLPPGYYAKRNVGDLMKTNDQMLSMLMMTLRNAGIATPNELRPWVNLPPSDEVGANSLFSPLNSAPVDWYDPKTNGLAPTAANTDVTGDPSANASNSTNTDDD